MNLLNALTIASYIAFNVDYILQIRRIYMRKSSNDISLLGLSIRYAAVMIVLTKFISLSDLPLMIGQGFIAISITIYFILVVAYRTHKTTTPA